MSLFEMIILFFLGVTAMVEQNNDYTSNSESMHTKYKELNHEYSNDFEYVGNEESDLEDYKKKYFDNEFYLNEPPLYESSFEESNLFEDEEIYVISAVSGKYTQGSTIFVSVGNFHDKCMFRFNDLIVKGQIGEGSDGMECRCKLPDVEGSVKVLVSEDGEFWVSAGDITIHTGTSSFVFLGGFVISILLIVIIRKYWEIIHSKNKRKKCGHLGNKYSA